MIVNVRSRTFFKSWGQVSPRPLRLSLRKIGRYCNPGRVTLALVNEG